MALGLLLRALGSPTDAWCQFDLYRSEIEIKRLDFHPVSPYRPERGTDVYGAVDLAVRLRHPSAAVAGDCAGADRSRMSGFGASFLGIRSADRLSGDWVAFARLEHEFPASGVQGDVQCSPPFWDRSSVVGLGSRSWGSVELGRQNQPARQVALMADPWGGSSVVLDPAGAYPLVPGIDGINRSRSSDALTYRSTDLRALSVQLQTQLESGRAREFGAAAGYSFGNHQVGIGWQRWDQRNRALPIAWRTQLDRWRLSAGVTVGRDEGLDYRNVLLGATLSDWSSPRLREWRFALNLHRSEGAARSWQASLGSVRWLGRQTMLQWELGARQPVDGGRHGQAAVGIRHEFAL